jgi:hypothetical protein
MVVSAVLVPSIFLINTNLLGAEATPTTTAENNSNNVVDKFLSIASTSAEVRRWWNGEEIVSLMDSWVKVRATIPLDGMSGNVGYAWQTDGYNNVLVLISHLPIDENSYQMPGPGYYTYVLDMKDPSPSCAGYDMELDIPGSTANSAFDKDYEWSVDGKRLKISKVPTADLGDAGVDSIVAIRLVSVLSEETVSNVCVDVIENPYHGL